MEYTVNIVAYLGLLLGLTGCGTNHQQNTDSTSPNILLILTDDMGYGDVGISGNTIIKTPNLDKLGARSVRFRNFYVSPVCAPTRASLLTGRYHQRTGVRSVTNGYETMDPDEITIAEILKEHNYRTGIFGKWHLGEYYPSVPNAQGFDEYLGFRTGHTDFYFDPTLEHNGQPVELSGHITEILSINALEFMTEESQKPFFCYLAYNAPHTPLQVDSSWWDPYASLGIKERNARIYGMVEQLDSSIGGIIDSLNKKGLLDNTIVIFMSDNGPINGWKVPQEEMRFNAGLRDQKFTIYEGGIRTQCYWTWGDRWKSKESTYLAAHIDVLPTLLDLLSLGIPEVRKIDGKSLKPVLEQSNTPADERVIFQKYSLETLRIPAPFPGGIARKGPWKMVNGNELYHLEDDTGEQTNLSETHPDILSALNIAYKDWYKDIATDHDMKSLAITVGHKEENPVYLQPHHGVAQGHVQFWGNRGISGETKGTHPTGVDSNWTGSWQSAGDAMLWDVQLVTTGDYVFKIVARDTSNQETNNLRLFINEQAVNEFGGSLLLDAHWSEYVIGESTLETGKTSIKIALEEDIKSCLEIRALVMEKLPTHGPSNGVDG